MATWVEGPRRQKRPSVTNALDDIGGYCPAEGVVQDSQTKLCWVWICQVPAPLRPVFSGWRGRSAEVGESPVLVSYCLSQGTLALGLSTQGFQERCHVLGSFADGV